MENSHFWEKSESDYGQNHLRVPSLQNYLRKSRDTFFVRWNKYFHIYEDTFERRCLEMMFHYVLPT